MTDTKVIAPCAVLHACAMALDVGMLVVLLRGAQEPRPAGGGVACAATSSSALRYVRCKCAVSLMVVRPPSSASAVGRGPASSAAAV